MDHPIDAQLLGINKSTSIPGESPGLISDSLRRKPMLKLPIEPIKEHVEAPENDSISSGSPLGDKAQYSPKGLVLGGVDYNFNTSYCYYPTIFDSLPTKAVSEDEEDDDDRYLWEPKEKAANERDIMFGHTEKEESEEDRRKKALEKDREPNFFVNDEGFRVNFAI